MCDVELLNYVADRVRDFVVKVYEGARGRVPISHDLTHVIRVSNVALKLGRVLGLNLRELKLLEIACYLHDIAIPLFGKEDHASRSGEFARKLLTDLGLCSECVRVVVTAISEHSWSSGLKPSNIISAILQDADRLDALGVIGFARVIAYGAYLGRAIHDLTEVIPQSRPLMENKYCVDHVFTKLIHLPNSMNFEVSKVIARSRLERLMRLVNELEREVKGLDIEVDGT